MEKFLKKYYKLFFLSLAIFLLYPTLQNGYIFLLDWPVKPNISLADIDWGTDPIVRIGCYVFSSIFSFEIFQRIYLWAIIFFLGLAGFRLVKNTHNIFAQYFAGLFFIFNPFIYARLVEQPGIALGSLFFFCFLIYLLEYLKEKEKNKKIWLASTFAGLAIASFAHSVFFIAVSLVALLVFDYLKNKDYKFIFKTALIIGLMAILLNGNWLFSFANGTSRGVGGIRNFSLEDAEAFKVRGKNGDSVYYTVLAMQGYWGEYQQDRIVSIRDNRLWEIGFVLIFFLAIFGLIKTWKNNRFAKPLAVIFAMAFILAVGVSSPLFKPLTLWLYQHFPLYIGLREPQKWVAAMVFVYAFFSGWGIKYLLELKFIQKHKKDIGLVCVFLPIIFSFSAIKGIHNHFQPGNFPTEWYQAKKYLENTQGRILFFPWHSYMDFDFTGKNVVVPAKPFFGDNLIVSNNTEFGRVYSHHTDEQTLTIEKYVPQNERYGDQEIKFNYDDFPEDMKKMGIKHIILTKSENWREYLWLDTIGARKALENEKIIIYEL